MQAPPFPPTDCWALSVCLPLVAALLAPAHAPAPCSSVWPAAMQLCVNVACAYMLRRNWSWGSGSSGGAKDLAAGAASDAKGAPAGGSDDTKGVPDSAEEAKGLK